MKRLKYIQSVDRLSPAFGAHVYVLIARLYKHHVVVKTHVGGGTGPIAAQVRIHPDAVVFGGIVTLKL